MRPLVALSLLAFCALAAANPEEPPKPALEEARKASAELVTSVRGELIKAVEASGPLRAIVVCKYTVPEIASAVSRKYGARITRVSLAPRNPSLGWGDAWEQKVLMAFEERVAKGEKAEGLEQYEVVAEPSGRFLRYMRALPQLHELPRAGRADQRIDPQPAAARLPARQGHRHRLGQGARRGHLQEAAVAGATVPAGLAATAARRHGLVRRRGPSTCAPRRLTAPRRCR
jgi:Protein of unknown function (DUF3365)